MAFIMATTASVIQFTKIARQFFCHQFIPWKGCQGFGIYVFHFRTRAASVVHAVMTITGTAHLQVKERAKFLVAWPNVKPEKKRGLAPKTQVRKGIVDAYSTWVMTRRERIDGQYLSRRPDG